MSVASRWGRRAIEASRSSITWLSFALASFLILGLLVRYSLLQHVDETVSRELQEMSLPVVDQAMRAISHCGDAVTLITLALALSLLLIYKGHRRTGTYVLLSLLSLPLDYLLKSVWGRPRPDRESVNVLVEQFGYSFPSGHALGSTAVYGFLAVIAWIHLKDHGIRLPSVVVLGSLPVLVCVSRVYLGAHWFSDVIGGMTVGIAVVLVLASSYRTNKEEVAKPIDPSTEAAPTS